MTTETGEPCASESDHDPTAAGERMHDDSIEQLLTDEVIGGAGT